MANYVQKAVDGLKQVRSQLVEELDRIDTALAALGAGENKSKSTRTTKPCCKKSEVTEIVTKLLRDNQALSRTELEELAKDKLSNELGKSLSGFAMRFKEALTAPLFTEYEPGQYRLSRKDERLGA